MVTMHEDQKNETISTTKSISNQWILYTPHTEISTQYKLLSYFTKFEVKSSEQKAPTFMQFMYSIEIGRNK